MSSRTVQVQEEDQEEEEEEEDLLRAPLEQNMLSTEHICPLFRVSGPRGSLGVRYAGGETPPLPL